MNPPDNQDHNTRISYEAPQPSRLEAFPSERCAGAMFVVASLLSVWPLSDLLLKFAVDLTYLLRGQDISNVRTPLYWSSLSTYVIFFIIPICLVSLNVWRSARHDVDSVTERLSIILLVLVLAASGGVESFTLLLFRLGALLFITLPMVLSAGLLSWSLFEPRDRSLRVLVLWMLPFSVLLGYLLVNLYSPWRFYGDFIL